MSPERACRSRKRRIRPWWSPQRSACRAVAIIARPPPATLPSGTPSGPVGTTPMPAPRLLAVSDLHVRHPENRELVDGLRPGDHADWLIVAGDVSELAHEVLDTLALLAERFARVIW